MKEGIRELRSLTEDHDPESEKSSMILNSEDFWILRCDKEGRMMEETQTLEFEWSKTIGFRSKYLLSMWQGEVVLTFLSFISYPINWDDNTYKATGSSRYMCQPCNIHYIFKIFK